MTRSVAEKMGLRAGQRAVFLGAPPEAVAAIGAPELELAGDSEGELDVAFLFARRAADLESRFAGLRLRIAPRGKLWLAWPKGGGLGTDLTLARVIELGYERGMVESTTLSVDETWSAIKFTHPIPGKRYANSYGTLRPPPDE